jgi:hypothetical protein
MVCFSEVNLLMAANRSSLNAERLNQLAEPGPP